MILFKGAAKLIIKLIEKKDKDNNLFKTGDRFLFEILGIKEKYTRKICFYREKKPLAPRI